VRAGLLIRIRVTAARRGATAGRMPTGHSLAPLADVPDRQRRDGGPRPRPRGLSRAARADPVGGLVSGAAAASSSRCMRNQRITRRRTRSVSAARSACVIGRAADQLRLLLPMIRPARPTLPKYHWPTYPSPT
jgi:hypothetical protein